MIRLTQVVNSEISRRQRLSALSRVMLIICCAAIGYVAVLAIR